MTRLGGEGRDFQRLAEQILVTIALSAAGPPFTGIRLVLSGLGIERAVSRGATRGLLLGNLLYPGGRRFDNGSDLRCPIGAHAFGERFLIDATPAGRILRDSRGIHRTWRAGCPARKSCLASGEMLGVGVTI